MTASRIATARSNSRCIASRTSVTDAVGVGGVAGGGSRLETLVGAAEVGFGTGVGSPQEGRAREKAKAKADDNGRTMARPLYARLRYRAAVTSLVRLCLPDDGPNTGTVSRWLVAEGREVTVGQSVVEVETDKASFELSAATSGVLLRIFHPVGASVGQDSVLAVIGPRGADPRALLELLLTAGDPAPLAASAVGLRCRGDCPECGARLAINGPYAAVRCCECGSENPVSPAIWSQILDTVASGRDFARIFADPWSLIVRVVRGPPECHNCGSTLVSDIATVNATNETIACGQCGLQHAQTLPPAWMQAKFPWLVGLLGCVDPATLARPQIAECLACGGRQTVASENSPIPRCAYCGNDVRPPGRASPLPRRWYLLR